MKVLITGPNLDDDKQIGGIITVIQTILSEITVDYSFFSRSPRQGDKVSILGKIKWFGKLFQFLQINLKGNFDVIHVHTAMNKSALLRDFIWVFLGKFFKVKILLHVHGGKFLFEKPSSSLLERIANLMFDRSDAIIVLSYIEQESLRSIYSIKNATYVLENAINLKEIPDLKSESDSEKGNTINLLFIGRITESKGLHDILEGIKLMSPEELSKFSFDMYGEGDILNEISQGLSDLMGDNYQYHGIVSGNEKWKAFHNSDVFLLPSRYGEGLPMALLEAMALGKIVLTTNDASIGLVVQNDVNGYLVEKYSPESIKGKLLQIANLKDEEINQISDKAHNTVLENFSSESYIKKLESIYAKSVES